MEGRWTITVCPRCERQPDEMDGLWCLDHPKPVEFVKIEVQPRNEVEVERLREALETIADRTYDTQYSSTATPSVVRFAGGVHVLARLALDPKEGS